MPFWRTRQRLSGVDHCLKEFRHDQLPPKWTNRLRRLRRPPVCELAPFKKRRPRYETGPLYIAARLRYVWVVPVHKHDLRNII